MCRGSGAEGTLNIVTPTDGYQRGFWEAASLTRKENVATQPWSGQCEVGQRISPDELELLLFRLEEGAGARGGVAEGARRVRDNEDAFRLNVREDIWSNGVTATVTPGGIIVLDCVDSIEVLVGHPNLTAVGPEAWRHYSWSFNLYAKRPRDLRDNSVMGNWIFVNSKDVALPARYDHVVTKCAKMVERNPVVIRCEARPDRRKQRDGTFMDLEDQSAFCGENVARGEPGIGGHRWSNS